MLDIEGVPLIGQKLRESHDIPNSGLKKNF